MRVLKISVIASALTVALSTAVFAQTAPKPAPTAPPPAAQAPAAPKPQPPVAFPQDAKIAFIDVNMIASGSASGKDASNKLKALNDKKLSELNDKNKQLQALTTRRDTGGVGVLNDTARAQLDKDIDKLQRDIQFAQTNAQAELQDLQNELQGEFQKRLLPVIEEIAKEKGLHAVFSIADSGAAYVHPGLNISDEVIKRLDAAAAKK
jgi:outer membrane protein